MTELTSDLVESRNRVEERRANSRLLTKSTIQSAREKLTSATGLDLDFQFDTLKLYARSKVSSCFTLSVYTTLIALSLLAWVPAGLAMLWWFAASMMLVVGALYSRRFLHEATIEEAASWRVKFIALEGSLAMIWSSICLFALLSDAAVFAMFLMLTVAVYATATAWLASPVKSAIASGMFPLVLMIGIVVSARQNPETALFAAVVVGSLVFSYFLAQNAHQRALETLGVTAEKNALFAALEEAHAKQNEARRRAEEANLAKSRFLATMSHELRTPLNAILGFSEVMKNELFGAHAVPQYKEYANDVHSSGQHLLEIINEILDLSRVEAGRYELKPERVLLGDIADECRNMLDLRARAKHISVAQKIAPNMPPIWADERAVRQIIINLLSNAIKFTPQGGEVMIMVGWTALGGQYVSIKDNGTGIPEDEIELVQESFGRGTIAMKTAEQGTGLGLPIVKGLIDLHGGQFKLISKLRVGTEVVVSFPAERVMETLDQMESATAA
jgi:two-component system, cell cycle sensor histidine kinase PleC